jgi:hypothetical protein
MCQSIVFLAALAACMAMSSLPVAAELNETCLELAKVEAKTELSFLYDTENAQPWLAAAWVDDLSSGGVGNHSFRVDYMTWRRNSDGIEWIMNHLMVDEGNNPAEFDEPKDVSWMLQAAKRGGASAAVYVGNDGEEYLTVNTSSSATSCTLRLSHHAGHGPIITAEDKIFGFMGFNSDQTLLAYTAERTSLVGPKILRGPAALLSARDPVLILFDVVQQTFSVANIPHGLKPGFWQWHPTLPWLAGAVWHTEPLADMFPSSGASSNHLFVYSVDDDNFSVVPDSHDQHYESPRFAPDGASLIYFERNLRSVRQRQTVVPGPDGLSLRLVHVTWDDFVDAAGQVKGGKSLNRHVVIPNGQDAMEPMMLVSGEEFYGLYLHQDMWAPSPPERIFSADGQTLYLSVIQMSDVRLLGVHLPTGRLEFHDEPGLVLLDVHDNLVLVRRDLASQGPELAIGRLHPDYLATTTTTMSTTTTTMTSTTTTVEPDRNTTLDPCEHLLQELETTERINVTVINLANQTTTTSTMEETSEDFEATTMTTMPTTTEAPLTVSTLIFSPLTQTYPLPLVTQTLRFSRPRPAGWDWGRQGVLHDTPFSAWLMLPIEALPFTGSPSFSYIQGAPL